MTFMLYIYLLTIVLLEPFTCYSHDLRNFRYFDYPFVFFFTECLISQDLVYSKESLNRFESDGLCGFHEKKISCAYC